jgi:BirA family biotin operon repressor/biotin-[acetyl-CoA-carboxylase] ligase
VAGISRSTAPRPALGRFHLYRYPRLRSTSDHARTLIDRRRLRLPAVVATANQTAGRGRNGNGWWSGPGCLTVTFAIRASAEIAPEHVPLYAAIAFRRALAKLTAGGDVLLKWPNDLVYDGRKLAGLLCERHRSVDLIGLGLNIAPRRFPARLAGRASCLREVTGRRFEATAVLDQIAEQLASILIGPAPGLREVLAEYERYHSLRGRDVAVSDDQGRVVAGMCEGLDGSGRLLVRAGTRLHRLVCGTVRTV